MVRHSLAILKIDNICYPLGHMEVSPACTWLPSGDVQKLVHVLRTLYGVLTLTVTLVI